jgi:ABC-type bacteriocin/lantibiotic exporter with double-glycine peptidase domain
MPEHALGPTLTAGRPAAPPPVHGFDAIEAVWRLLRLHGDEELGLQAFRDAHDAGGSAEALAEPLERAGIQARPALVEAEEIAYLDLPTLLQLKDGTWVVLRDRARVGLDVEGVDGVVTLPLEELEPHLSGYALDLSPSLPPGKGLFDRMRKLVLAHRRTLGMLAAASGLLQLLALAVPEITATVMNRALPDRAASTLHVVALGVVLVAAFQAWLGFLRERILLFLTTRVTVSAERGLLQHLLRLPFTSLDRMTMGERLQAMTGMGAARELVTDRTLAAVLDGFTAVTFVAAMLAKIPGPTAVVVVVALAMAALAVAVGTAQTRTQAREVEAQGRERGYLSELLNGVATIKAAGAERQGLRRWARRFAIQRGLALRRQRLGLWSDVGLETLRQALYAALLVWGGSLVLDSQLQVGTLFAFVQLSAGFLGAVFGFVKTYLTLAVVRPQLARTRSVLEQAPQGRPARGTRTRGDAVPVALEDVWFRYGADRPWIVKGYSNRFEAGAKAVVTGPSGFGKSTILRMLAGLCVPEEGSISIGGLSPHAATSDILYLPQFVTLFSGSIAENLRLLSGGAPIARIVKAAESTGLSAFVATLPMKYYTVLAPGGRSISGGQRQLIALTAALASDRKLLLLDEALSNIDPIFAVGLRKLIEELPSTVIEARHV